MAGQIFRKVSLERLSSPEQLDQLIQVTTPRGWFALLAIVVLLIIVIFWGILGSVHDKVLGQGILMRAGGVVSVTVMHSGKITGIAVGVGDTVERGQIVARVHMPEMIASIAGVRASLDELRGHYDIISEAGKEDAEAELAGIQRQIDAAERDLIAMEHRLDTSSRIRSLHSGRVLEITASRGDLASRGSRIMTLELVGRTVEDLEAIIFVPAIYGKKVKFGMHVQVAPVTVRREEYGVMLGRVVHVGEFPSTPAGMMAVLDNEIIVNQLLLGGAPIKVVVDLTPDGETVSGYRWSSPEGPPIEIQSGTLSTASIIVDTRPPITLVVPLLRGFLGGS